LAPPSAARRPFSAFLVAMVQHGHGLSPWAPKPDPEADARRRRTERWLLFVRYGVPVLIAISGFVVMGVASDREVGIEIGAMLLGAAIAVFLLNFFFRMGVTGDRDRDREEEARLYFDEHGRWPDDPA
jgi:hypothetical protein